MGDIEDNEYKVKKGDNLTKIARDNGLSVKQLLAMNPDLSKDKPLKIGETITLPSDGYYYIAQKGDTLTDIAKQNGVRVQALFAANPKISKSGAINVGQKISVPAQYYTYTVRKGDNLNKISNEQAGGDVSVNGLRRANPEINSRGVISVGQKIRVPTGYYIHTIKPGDTFYSVGKQYNVGVEEVREANSGVDQNNLKINQKIRIPSPSVQLATIINDTSNETKPDVKAIGATTKSFNKAGELQAYNISSKQTKKAWAETLRGVTYKPVKSEAGAKPLIVIDLGHGSKSHGGAYDQGAVSRDGTLTESEVVDAVGRSLAKQLDNKGYRVAFTRNPGEVFLYKGGKGARLEKRAMYAVNLERELKAPYTVFVSLHVNSAAGNAGRGYEIKTPRKSDSSVLYKNSTNLGTKVAAAMKKYHKSVFRKVAPQNLQMFREIAERGAYGGDAAILLELDFLNNNSGQGRLESMKDRPYNIAAGIRQGIESYVGQKSPNLTFEHGPTN